MTFSMFSANVNLTYCTYYYLLIEKNHFDVNLNTLLNIQLIVIKYRLTVAFAQNRFSYVIVFRMYDIYH